MKFKLESGLGEKYQQLRYTDVTILMAESEEKLKNLLMKVKDENEKAGLKLNTMEYYQAIKKATFESVLMWWMKLEPIIQSEVSQKGKHQYSMLLLLLSCFSRVRLCATP